MNTLSACRVIANARHDSIIVATMGAMNAFDELDLKQPRLSSVPLMGCAPHLGLGLAIANPGKKVIIVDGDASLLMQLGGLVTVAAQQPSNFYHFVIHNGTQFTGLSNLSLPNAPHLDFPGFARSAGYAQTHSYSDADSFAANIESILKSTGPVLVDLQVEPKPSSLGPDSPQWDWQDLQFTRMGDEARRLAGWLEQHV